MRLCRGERCTLALLLFVVAIAVACSGGPTNTRRSPQAAAQHDCPFASGQLTDSTIIKSVPLASGYEVRGPRECNFFPANTIITTAGNHLLVRAYTKIWAYRLTDVRVRRMSSLVWVDAKYFPAERSGAIVGAYRDSIRTGTRSVTRKTCPDCDAVFSDPAPPSGPPFPQIPQMPSLCKLLACPVGSIKAVNAGSSER
jgi:hypothetical protein